MAHIIFKRLSIFALPALLLVAAGLALPKIQQLPPDQLETALQVPYLAVTLGLILSMVFSRCRGFFVLLMLGLFYWCYNSYLAQGITGFPQQVLFQAFCLLLPINIAIFCFMRERGIFTNAGRLRLGFLLLQVAATAWIVRFKHDYQGVPGFIGKEFVESRILTTVAIPQSALLLFLLAGLLISTRTFMRRYPVDSGMLGALIAVGIAANWLWTPQVPVVFLAAAAIILSISVLQDTHNLAFRDDLTGLPSRRALNEQLMGLGRRYTVAMLDVDHFKAFNDTYGHNVGDQVLKMVGSKIIAVRGGGKPYRYGGEEFTVIFPGKEPKEVIPHLEELRKSIAAYQLWLRSSNRPGKPDQGKRLRGERGGEQAVSVTISIGVATSVGSMKTAEEVIQAADKALYSAKRKGRNQLSS